MLVTTSKNQPGSSSLVGVSPKSYLTPNTVRLKIIVLERIIGELGNWENNYLPTSLSPYIPIPPPINKSAYPNSIDSTPSIICQLVSFSWRNSTIVGKSYR